MDEINKCWCTYGVYYATGFGKIIKETSETVVILYSEKQVYPAEYWENRPQYICRFDTLEEAAKKYQHDVNNFTDMRMDHPISDEQIESQMRYAFPSYFKSGGKE